MTKKQFVIGMDGGATKTAALLSDLEGVVLAEETGGPSNPQVVGPEKTADVIVGLVERLCSKAQCSTSQVLVVVAGLAGAGRDGDKERVKTATLAEAKKRKTNVGKVVIESDGRIALEGALKGRPGIILIAGTGSFSLAKDHKGGIHRAGGWGRVVGDEGSGLVIGRDGLNAVAKHIDGRGKATMLTRLVDEKLGLSNQEKIINAVYRENFDVATVAPLVIEAAEAKDVECARILNKATFELAEHVRTLVNKIEQKITFSLPQVTVIVPEAPPAYGAVLLSIRFAQEYL
ncbi:MAG: hypothetical protein NTU47_09300 [Ignavibacteriales bacterium]|nr:hypothetical protein [Ignavibacteriales bacterium]